MKKCQISPSHRRPRRPGRLSWPSDEPSRPAESRFLGELMVRFVLPAPLTGVLFGPRVQCPERTPASPWPPASTSSPPPWTRQETASQGKTPVTGDVELSDGCWVGKKNNKTPQVAFKPLNDLADAINVKEIKVIEEVVMFFYCYTVSHLTFVHVSVLITGRLPSPRRFKHDFCQFRTITSELCGF